MKTNDYCSAHESAISVHIVDPSKHVIFLLQKQLYDEVHPAFEDSMDILADETVVTETLSLKMNSVQMTMILKTQGRKGRS